MKQDGNTFIHDNQQVSDKKMKIWKWNIDKIYALDTETNIISCLPVLNTYNNSAIIKTQEHASLLNQVVKCGGNRGKKMAHTWPVLSWVSALPDAKWPE